LHGIAELKLNYIAYYFFLIYIDGIDEALISNEELKEKLTPEQY
jgi:hypothetical protein